MSLLNKVRGLQQFRETQVAPEDHRVHVDGDYLAYWAACKDDTPPGIAREVAYNKLQKIKHDTRSREVVLHLTSGDSTKGVRYLVAETQPYQAKRSGSKPKNWEALRIWMEERECGPDVSVIIWDDREADDGAAYYMNLSGYSDFLCFADKDLRMVPGKHLVWDSHEQVEVPTTKFSVTHNGKIYGPRWFWIQMLAGDTVDGIPGLPEYRVSKDKWQAIAEKRATGLITEDMTDRQACDFVLQQYRAYGRKHKLDGDRLFCEQAILLWMRRDSGGSLRDFFRAGDTVLLRSPRVEEAVKSLEEDVAERAKVLEDIRNAAAENY